MKFDKTIYIKCDKCLLSKNALYAILSVSTVSFGTAFYLNSNQIITQSNAYLIFCLCSLFTLVSLFGLIKQRTKHYIYINNDEIFFKQNKTDEEVCLKFAGLDHFETRFSEIIFSTKQHEKIVLPLNKISNEQKRWEIKEFLRERVTQIKTKVIVA